MASLNPVSIRGNSSCIATCKVRTACAAVGWNCQFPSTRTDGALEIEVVGARFDEHTANIAVTLAVASAAASRPADAKFRSPVADSELEELLSWDTTRVFPHVAVLVEYGTKQGASAAASWASTADVSSAVPPAVATSFAALRAALVELEARLAANDGKSLYAGCSPAASTAIAAVFGTEFFTLANGAAAFPLASVAPAFAAWLSTVAWSQSWFPATACSSACAFSSAPVASTKSDTSAPATQVAAGGGGGKKKGGSAASAAPVSEGPAGSGATPKPAKVKFDKAAAKAASGGAAGLLAAVTDAPLAPSGGAAAFSDESLRLPLVHTLVEYFSRAIAAAFPGAAEKGITRADVSAVTQVC
jgi:hypothetical protein